MRTTTQLLLCSLLAACAQVGGGGGRYYGSPDAGSGSSARTCDDLVSVPGDMTITGSSGFTGLPTGCWELGGKLTLRGPAISSLDKLGDLRTVGSLEIDSTELSSIAVPDMLHVTGDLAIHHNTKLVDISKVMPHGDLSSLMVEYNDVLPSLGGLSETTRVTGATTIENNPKLASIDLSHATRLEGGLTIQDNDALTSVDLGQLSSVGPFSLTHNISLTTLKPLTSLSYIHGSLTVSNNTKLSGLDGMSSSMTSVDGSIAISNNTALTSLGQLTHVGLVGGSVLITGNTNLDYCQPQPFTCCMQITGTLQITGTRTSSCQQHSWCWNNGCPYQN
ncbi:MAG: hypothetical protein JO257_09435 [Deltaproteobacteria bacterium]|nr:hypothetical protein [Deltaproteobacteria bacterium]